MSLKQNLHRLRYFCSDAWDECRHSMAVNLLALGTLTSALFVAGLITLILFNVDRRVQGLRGELRIDVYLQDDHDEQGRLALIDELETLDGVARIEYVDKDEALRRYREWSSDMAELVNEVESNPLPASLEVYLDPDRAAVDSADGIAVRLKNHQDVEDVRFSQDWLHRLESVVQMARLGGSTLAVIVFIAVVFVMSSVLRLAVHARLDEIKIMQLVGATPAFVRGPFLVAGVAQGLIASILALAIVEGFRQAAMASAGSGATILLDLVAARPLPGNLTILLVVVGLAVSLTGSYFAVRRPI